VLFIDWNRVPGFIPMMQTLAISGSAAQAWAAGLQAAAPKLATRVVTRLAWRASGRIEGSCKKDGKRQGIRDLPISIIGR